MAYERNITAEDDIYFDTDNYLDFTVYQGKPTAEQIASGDVIPENVSGYALTWVLKKKAKDDASLIEKTTVDGITIIGVYDVDPTVNTQQVRVRIKDTDTYNPGSPSVYVKPGTYVHALKRVDDDNETIYTTGSFVLKQAPAWE